MSYSIREAKSQFSTVCDAAHNGETIVITKNGKPWADLIPHTDVHRNFEPIVGIALPEKQRINMDVILDAMPEEDLALWEGTGDDSDAL